MTKKAEISYKDALTELEKILVDIQNNQINVDQLTDRVARASELIKFCKDKLKTTETQITEIFEDDPS